MSYIGAHIGIHDSLITSANVIRNLGGNLLQIFLSKPGKKKTLKISKKDLLDFKKYLVEHDMKVVVHASYLVNLADKWDDYTWWITSLELEIEYAHHIGAFGIVVHLGKKLEHSNEEALNNMYTALLRVHNKTKKYQDVKILLETSSGQGSEMCYKLEEFSYFYKKFSLASNAELRERIQICIDSCHIFAAGYDIRSSEKVKLFIDAFEELIGLRHVALLHLNDSKTDIGSNIDRHENIGKGFIGKPGLVSMIKFFKKIHVPILLETPEEFYKEDFKILFDV